MSENNNLQYLTVSMVSGIVCRSEYTVREWLRKGKLRGHKTENKNWLVNEEDVKKFVESSKKQD